MNTAMLFDLFRSNLQSPGVAPTAGFDSLNITTVSPDLGGLGRQSLPIAGIRIRGGIDVFWCHADARTVVVAGESEAACASASVSFVGGELSISGGGSTCVVGGGRVVIGDNRGVVIQTDGTATISANGGFASTGDIHVYASRGAIAAGRRIVVNGVDVTATVGNAPGMGRVVVFVASPVCPDIELEGSSDVLLSAVYQKTLTLRLSGSGAITADGRVDDLRVVLLGSGDVRAKDLETVSLDCELKGSGDIHARASQSVKSRLYGSGDIVVAGSPAQRDTRVQGSGDVRFVGP